MIILIDLLLLIFSNYWVAWLAAFFSWCPSIIIQIFPLLILLDTIQRIPDFKEKLNIWKTKH
jgi:hypothetical protein